MAQQQIWLHAQLAPHSPMYNEALILRHQGFLDVRRVELLWREIAQRHGILRTRFPIVDGVPLQEIVDEAGKLHLTDLRASQTKDGEFELLELLEKDLREPFVLSKEPPVRPRLIRVSQERWYLSITLHALIADEESLELLAAEWRNASEQPTISPEGVAGASVLRFEYADYACWQRNIVSERLEKNAEYWRQRLRSLSPALELPIDHPRPAIQEWRGARESLRLPTGLTESLKELGEREGASLDTLLCAGFQALLARYTGQTDIVLGWIVNNRGRELCGDTQAIVGPLSQTVVSRTEVDDQWRFVDLLRAVNDTSLRDYEHKDLPFDRLIEDLRTGWDPSRNTLFQALYSFVSRFNAAGTDWGAVDLEVHTGAAKVDLQLQMYEDSDGVCGRLTFNTALFDRETISRMKRHLETLLEGVASDASQLLSRISLLDEWERNQLLTDWNDTWMDYPRDLCIHQLFELQAERAANETAVICESSRLTYGELNRQANCLAHKLRERGVGPEALVGICVERSLEMVVGLLGILKAGAAYVPIDPAYPGERIAFMLEDSEVAVLITQEHLRKYLPQTRAQLICLDSDWPAILQLGGDNPASGVRPQNRAYVIYTSGSTGKPKGVEIQHGAVVNFLASMSRMPGMSREDKLLAVTTLSFDIAGLEIYLPLSVGASFEVVRREIASDGIGLAKRLRDSKANVMQATPATWRMLIEAGWKGDERLKVLCGGEALPRSLANQLLERAGSVWNMYGPTETTIWSTVSPVRAGEEALTIGRPIANTELFILDKWLQPTPIGVAGELHIGGEGLARGYLKRPELSAEKFIHHPFKNVEARIYKTGDLARYLANGTVEFHGRIDHQVKIRGFRIELGEIEARLRRFHGISDAVVVAREDRSGGQRLVAYFACKPGCAPAVADIRAFLKESLPEHMAPSAFIELQSLPLTPNGKVDRKALPNPQDFSLRQDHEIVGPRDALEAELVRIWENVLDIRPIGIEHNFFELGGHSLLAVRLTHQIGLMLRKNVPVATLLEAPTIQQLSAVLRKDGWSSPWSSLVPIQTNGSKTPFFCVHGAAGTVIRFRNLAHHLDSDRPFYALQPQGLDPQYPCHTRVEDMAAHYLAELRCIQPSGPYLFGGYSLGGLIALEMAQQLVAEGQPAPWVGLFDTFCPLEPGLNRRQANLGVLWRELVSNGRTFLRSSNSERRSQAVRIVRTLAAGVERRFLGARLPARLKTVRRACKKAADAYAPKPYDGRIVLFRSKYKPLTQFRDPHAGWKKYATQGLEIREVDGDHDSVLLEPQVKFIAEQLSACLEDASPGGKFAVRSK
ncbi:MAG: amino acid adenylation domain-containing protein [Acidobacteriaceae bacterium]|nr:amino acid adenylation domain-containing protein [Acidobacteriaceae bacterium]